MDDPTRSRVTTDRMPQMAPGEEHTAVNPGDADLRCLEPRTYEEPTRALQLAYHKFAVQVILPLPLNRRRARAMERLIESLHWATLACDE